MNIGSSSRVDTGPVRRFGVPITAVSIVAVPTFLARIIFLRVLSIEDAARLVLFFAAVPLCAFIGNLGQSGVIARYYSRMEKGMPDWRADLLSSVAIISLPTILCVIVVSIYNQVNLALGVAIAASAVTMSLTQQIARMLVATENFTLGSILDRLPGSLMIIAAVLLWALQEFRSVQFVANGFMVANVIVLLCGLLLLQKRLPRGRRTLKLQERKVGFSFWISSGVGYLREHILIVAVQPAVSPMSLAAFDAVSVFFRAFGIVREPLSSIMLVDITRAKKPAYGRRVLGVGLFGLLASAASLLLIPILLDPVYSGRYDQALWMIPWLLVYHVTAWLYTIPSGYIFGRSSEATLTRFINLKVITAILILSVGAVLTYEVGFSAFLGTLVGAVVFQTGLGYVFLLHYGDKDEGRAVWDPGREMMIE